MEELFNVLSSSARLKKPKKPPRKRQLSCESDIEQPDEQKEEEGARSRDRTGKRDVSEEKRQQVHKEQVAAFRRSMSIRLANHNKHDPSVPDPISSFHEIMNTPPQWWTKEEERHYQGLGRAILKNIEAGRWKEPTPIQMQSIPTLMERRDFIGAAPTGSGKSGGFIIPALFLSNAPYHVFYGTTTAAEDVQTKKKKNKKRSKNSMKKMSGKQGEIRSLLLAPSLELASQLHREVERLGMGLPGGRSSVLLSKSNALHVISGEVGGKNGLDILVSTPLRLVDCIEKGLRLDQIRLVVLDEADRLLDATDGKKKAAKRHNNKEGGETGDKVQKHHESLPSDSGSAQSRTFLSQMDIILSEIPTSAVRALFSATVTPTVRSLAESILRNPVDVTIQSSNAPGGANPDIEQELMFVGREEGKLLAIRQLVQRGQLRPPVIIFLESQDRAQALFSELLYDGIHVDVIHAGRSKSARENAVARFRRGDTWVLICTDVVGRGVDFRAVNMVINYDLPESGITYVHRIGRTGRAGRKGKAITLFTEEDFDNLRTIANIMKQSGCKVEEWMLNLSKKGRKDVHRRRRKTIDTTPRYDKAKRRKKQQMIEHSKQKAQQEASSATKRT